MTLTTKDVTAEKLAKENNIHLLSFIIETAARSQNSKNKNNQYHLSLETAETISKTSNLIGALSSLFFFDYTNVNEDFIKFVEGKSEQYGILQGWINSKIEPIRDALSLSNRLDLSKPLKKYTVVGNGKEAADALYLSIIQSLIDIDDFDSALTIAEKGLTHFTPDFLLKLYVENMSDHTKSYKLVSKIQDKELAFSLIEIYMEEWDIDTCV